MRCAHAGEFSQEPSQVRIEDQRTGAIFSGLEGAAAYRDIKQGPTYAARLCCLFDCEGYFMSGI
jgi:hypothetical protein